MVDVGERVKKARQAAGLTQMELAKKINVSRSYIGNIEQNRHASSIATLQLIADALHVDISEFVGNVNTIQEIGMTNDEIYLVMNFRDLADNDKATVQNLITSLRLANKQVKSARYTSLPPPLAQQRLSSMKGR